MMIYTTTTSTPIETIKSEIEDKAEALGFSLLKSYDFKEVLTDKGYPIEKEITMYELCNPKGAQQSLSEITAISVYLPCRISLYEENGVSTLSTMGFEEILCAMKVDEDFRTFMTILFVNIKRVMHCWDK